MEIVTLTFVAECSECGNKFDFNVDVEDREEEVNSLLDSNERNFFKWREKNINLEQQNARLVEALETALSVCDDTVCIDVFNTRDQYTEAYDKVEKAEQTLAEVKGV